MAKLINFEPTKTYATRENALKAVAKVVGVRTEPGRDKDGLEFFVMQNSEGRWFPVFVGERATQAGMHFHFCVVS